MTSSQPIVTTRTPQLAPPGAGIPWLERFLAGAVFKRLALRKADWDTLVRRYEGESTRIINLVQDTPPSQLHRTVLIPRLRGLEDSSRNWSASMTVEHLTITMPGMTSIVTELLAGRRPTQLVSTADVKPKGIFAHLSGQEVAESFRLCAENSAATLQRQAPSPHTHALPTFPHPWFGEFRAIDWVWLLWVHQALHRKQIELVL